jgi:drug/metabolite transporter (DMT)-like permease
LGIKKSGSLEFQLYLAFAAVYVIWGSTYLGIKFGIKTIPPFLMAGTRFVIAGLVMYAIAVAKGASLPFWKFWKDAIIVGFLMLLIGNGVICWAEKEVPSGIAALIVATAPVWFVVLDWLVFKGPKPTPRMILGLVLGFSGIILLVGPGISGGGKALPLWPVLGIIMATVGWALGSLYAAHAPRLSYPMQATAMQMLCGGLWLWLTGLVAGELKGFHLSAVTASSDWALLYLIVFGSMIGYTAYGFLVRNAPPGKVSTYAYVNPVIALFLGWFLGGEGISGSSIAGACIIIGAVLIINLNRSKKAA